MYYLNRRPYLRYNAIGAFSLERTLNPNPYNANSGELEITHDFYHPNPAYQLRTGNEYTAQAPYELYNPKLLTVRGDELTLGGYVGEVMGLKGWKYGLEGSFSSILPPPFKYFDQGSDTNYMPETWEINFREGTTSGFFIAYPETPE